MRRHLHDGRVNRVCALALRADTARAAATKGRNGQVSIDLFYFHRLLLCGVTGFSRYGFLIWNVVHCLNQLLGLDSRVPCIRSGNRLRDDGFSRPIIDLENSAANNARV